MTQVLQLTYDDDKFSSSKVSIIVCWLVGLKISGLASDAAILRDRHCGYSRNSTICNVSVPARHIYEGAAPCPYWLAPCSIYKRPDRIIYLLLKKKNFNFCFHLQNVIAVVFSDSRCKNACVCRFVPMFSSIGHKIVPRPRFVRMPDCDRILGVRA